MRVKHRLRQGLVATSVASVALAAQGLGIQPASAATDIRIGVAPLTMYGIANYGQERGYFAKNGLNVTEVKVLANAPAQLAALAGGQIEFTYLPANSIIQARANSGMDITIVAPGNGPSALDAKRAQTDPAFARLVDPTSMCVKSDSPIKGWKDLQGKKVAINARGAFGEIAINEAIRKNGGDPTGIEWIVMGIPSMSQAVKNGLIDAAYVARPFTDQCEADGGRLLGSPALAYRTTGGVIMMWVATTKYVKANPQVIAAFQKSVFQMNSSLRGNKANQQALAIASTKITGVSQERALAEKLDYYYTSVTKKDLQAFMDAMLRWNIIKQPIDVGGVLWKQYKP